MAIEFSKLDINTWNRRDTFLYFSRIAPSTYSITSTLDITNMMRDTKKRNLKFFPSFLWLATSIFNEMEKFRVAIKGESVGHYKTLTPFYPTFHEDDHTISMLWTEYSPSLLEFHASYVENQKKYGENKGFLGIPDATPPENAYTISVIPWLSFSSFSLTTTSPHPYFFPSIEGGKFMEKEGRLLFPLSITVHHATTDDYHVSEFFKEFQTKADNFLELI